MHLIFTCAGADFKSVTLFSVCIVRPDPNTCNAQDRNEEYCRVFM